MKSISKIIPALMILISSASAQSLFTQSGTVELGGDFSLAAQSTRLSSANNNNFYYNSYAPYIQNSNQTIFSFNPYLGIMLTSGFELGVEPGIAITNPGATTTLDLYLAPAYNFTTKIEGLYPYAEFLIGYDSFKDVGSTSSGYGVGGDAGFKVAIGGGSLFLFKVQYLSQSVTLNVPFNPQSYYSFIPFVPIKYRVGTLSTGVGFRIFIPHSIKTRVPMLKAK